MLIFFKICLLLFLKKILIINKTKFFQYLINCKKIKPLVFKNYFA